MYPLQDLTQSAFRISQHNKHSKFLEIRKLKKMKRNNIYNRKMYVHIEYTHQLIDNGNTIAMHTTYYTIYLYYT
jgi:hypothetical protein